MSTIKEEMFLKFICIINNINKHVSQFGKKNILAQLIKPVKKNEITEVYHRIEKNNSTYS